MHHAAMLFALCACLHALDVPPPADPYGLGERLAMLSYIAERGVKAPKDLDDAGVAALYSKTWQADPAHAQQLAVLLRDEARTTRMNELRASIAQQFGITADASLSEEALQALFTRLDGEKRERQAEQVREAAARGELILQRVRFTDGGTMLGRYDATTGHIELYDPETGRRAGEMSLNPATVASVTTVTVPIRIAKPAQEAMPPAEGAAVAAEPAAEAVQVSSNPGSNGRWVTDYAVARRSAAADRRPILMLFTGSDWCSWCVKLEDEVLSTAAFREWASAHVVLLYLDFPRDKRIDAETALVSRGLRDRYEIRGFPTVLFVDAEGVKIGQTGYKAGGPGPWIAACRNLLTPRR